jgi:hypothetical protein
MIPFCDLRRGGHVVRTGMVFGFETRRFLRLLAHNRTDYFGSNPGH